MQILTIFWNTLFLLYGSLSPVEAANLCSTYLSDSGEIEREISVRIQKAEFLPPHINAPFGAETLTYLAKQVIDLDMHITEQIKTGLDRYEFTKERREILNLIMKHPRFDINMKGDRPLLHFAIGKNNKEAFDILIKDESADPHMSARVQNHVLDPFKMMVYFSEGTDILSMSRELFSHPNFNPQQAHRIIYFTLVYKRLDASWKTSIASNLIEGLAKALIGYDRATRSEIWEELKKEIIHNSDYSDYDDQRLLRLIERLEF